MTEGTEDTVSRVWDKFDQTGVSIRKAKEGDTEAARMLIWEFCSSIEGNRAKSVWLVTEESGIRSPAGLDREARRLLAIRDTPAFRGAAAWLKVGRLEAVDSLDEAILQLAENRADAFAIDQSLAKVAKKRLDDLSLQMAEAAGKKTAPSAYTIAGGFPAVGEPLEKPSGSHTQFHEGLLDYMRECFLAAVGTKPEHPSYEERASKVERRKDLQAVPRARSVEEEASNGGVSLEQAFNLTLKSRGRAPKASTRPRLLQIGQAVANRHMEEVRQEKDEKRRGSKRERLQGEVEKSPLYRAIAKEAEIWNVGIGTAGDAYKMFKTALRDAGADIEEYREEFGKED